MPRGRLLVDARHSAATISMENIPIINP